MPSAAITLVGVSVAGAGTTVTNTGTSAVILAGANVSGAGKSGITQSLTAAPALAGVGVAGAASHLNAGTGAATLAPISPSGAGSSGITQYIFGSTTLAGVQVSGTAQKDSIHAAVTLAGLIVAGAGHSGVTQSGAGAVTLKGIKPFSHLQNLYVGLQNTTLCVTGLIRADGTGIFQFQGLPYVPVSWSILVGSGAIAPLTSHTDAAGLAFAKYDAGGYAGPLQIGASF